MGRGGGRRAGRRGREAAGNPPGRRRGRAAGEGGVGIRRSDPGADDGHGRLFLALLLGLHREPQRRRPPSPRHGLHQRALRKDDRGAPRGRQRVLGEQAVPLLRLRQRDDLPALGRRHDRAQRPSADAADDLRGDRGAAPHRLLRRADDVRPAASRDGGGEPGPVVDPDLHLGRGGAAGRRHAALEGEDRDADPGRSRLDRDAPHLRLEHRGRLEGRLFRPPGAGLRGAAGRRGRRRRAGGRDGNAAGAGRVGGQALLEQPGEDRRHDAGRRLARHRRYVLPGRGRLLHQLRTRRRHDQGRRALVLAVRDRGASDRAPKGA